MLEINAMIHKDQLENLDRVRKERLAIRWSLNKDSLEIMIINVIFVPLIITLKKHLTDISVLHHLRGLELTRELNL